jgi:hypothetical protein
MPRVDTDGKKPNKNRGRGSGGRDKARLGKIGRSSAQIVREAAALLDEELAAGIVAAKQVQQRFQKDRHIDPRDFKKALEKFQRDAHEVVGLLDEQFSELRSKDNSEFAGRLLRNAHGVVDLAVELVNIGAEIADQWAQSNLKPGAQRRGKRVD